MSADLTATMASNGTTDPAALAKAIAEHFAARLTSMDVVNGAFIRTKAEVTDHGYITVDVTQVNYGGDDKTVRVLLQPTAPMEVATPVVAMTVPPVAAETGADVDPVIAGGAA